jgi:hypothetical protein
MLSYSRKTGMGSSRPTGTTQSRSLGPSLDDDSRTTVLLSLKYLDDGPF